MSHRLVKQLLALALVSAPVCSFAQADDDRGYMMKPGAGLNADKDSILSKRSNIQLKNAEVLDVYMFAGAFSMIDSTLVISDIQKMDQVRVNNRWFLTDRKQFETQFSEYVTDSYGISSLPFVMFSPKEKEVLKQRERLIKKSKKRKQFEIAYSGSAFRFSEPSRYTIRNQY